MSAYTVTSDIASLTKISKDTISIKPHNQFSGTQLNDERFTKLYSFYCGLLLEQYVEDCGKNEVNNDAKTSNLI